MEAGPAEFQGRAQSAGSKGSASGREKTEDLDLDLRVREAISLAKRLWDLESWPKRRR